MTWLNSISLDTIKAISDVFGIIGVIILLVQILIKLSSLFNELKAADKRLLALISNMEKRIDQLDGKMTENISFIQSMVGIIEDRVSRLESWLMNDNDDNG